MTETITKETHEALLDKALRDSERALREQLTAKDAEIAEKDATIAELTGERDSLKEDNARVNGELDRAQIDLRSATDKVTELTEAAEKASREAEQTKLATERADAAKNLGLFTPEYIAEKASAWGEMSSEDWAARVDEWKAIKPATSSSNNGGSGDVASAMSGSNGLTDEAGQQEHKIPARRAVLGLS